MVNTLTKSSVALVVMLLVSSFIITDAFGYGGSSGTKRVEICHNGNTIKVAKPAVAAHLKHGDTEGPCASPVPTVLGASTSPTGYTPIFSGLSVVLKNIQSGNQSGEISDEDAAKLTGQLANIFSALKALFQ